MTARRVELRAIASLLLLLHPLSGFGAEPGAKEATGDAAPDQRRPSMPLVVEPFTLEEIARVLELSPLPPLEDVVPFYSTLADSGPRREAILAPLDLDATQQADLVAFLQSLTDTALDADLTSPLPQTR